MLWPVALSILGTLSLLIWLAVLLHPARPWDAQPVGEDQPEPPEPDEWPSVAVLVPARNEAASLPNTLPQLLQQDYPGPLRIFVIDDRSEDDTAAVARRLASEHGAAGLLTVLAGRSLPEGWAGKVWALQQGVEAAGRNPLRNVEEPDTALSGVEGGRREPVRQAQSERGERGLSPKYFLLTDADICHTPGSLKRLVAESERDGLALNSRMARLRCESTAEKFLIPPFVFFFNLLYPMRQINDPQSATAGAAGGCVLLNAKALLDSGGFSAMKGALIDDCTLARQIKKPGAPLQLALSREAVSSLRAYESLGAIWRMVRRSAFTELKYSWLRLGGALFGMTLCFVVPPVLVIAGLVLLSLAVAGIPVASPYWSVLVSFKGLLAWGTMSSLARPIVTYYGRSGFWAWTLPLAGMLYGAMTLDSALRHLCGSGVKWR